MIKTGFTFFDDMANTIFGAPKVFVNVAKAPITRMTPAQQSQSTADLLKALGQLPKKVASLPVLVAKAEVKDAVKNAVGAQTINFVVIGAVGLGVLLILRLFR